MAWCALRQSDQAMTWAGWMRRWARRVVMRRSSWTDQRTRAGVSGAGAAVFRARRCFLWGRLVRVVAYGRHHGERQRDQADVAVPSVPGAGFVVVRPKLGPGRLEAVLDGPAAALDLDQLVCACSRRAPCGEERKLAVGQAAPGQQAAGPQAVAAGVEPARIEVGQFQVGPLVEPRAFRACACGQALPGRGVERLGDLLGRARHRQRAALRNGRGASH